MAGAFVQPNYWYDTGSYQFGSIEIPLAIPYHWHELNHLVKPLQNSETKEERQSIRARILDASEALFYRDGLLQVTVSKIVQLARISKRDFYKNFKNRDDVLLHIVNKLLQQHHPLLPTAAGKLDSTLLDVVCSSYRIHLTERSLALLRASIAASIHWPGLAEAVHMARAQVSAPVAEYLVLQQPEEKLSFDDPLLAALRLGFLATDGARYLLGMPPLSDEELATHARQVVDVFIRGHATAHFRSTGQDASSPWQDRQVLKAAPLDEPGSLSRTRLSKARWQRILDSSWMEFGEFGYDGASIERVAKSTGVPRSTIYRRYPSKKVLFKASAIHVIHRTFSDEIVLDWGHLSIYQAIRQVARIILDRFTQPDNVALQRVLLVESEHAPDMTRLLYSHLVVTIENLLGPLIHRLETAGIVRPELATRAAWRLFILSTLGNRFIFITPASEEERAALAAEAASQFLYGCQRSIPG